MDANLEEIKADLEIEEFHHEHHGSVGTIIKQVWICLQATMMTVFMIMGVRAYNKQITGWSKLKSLFVFQWLVICYLVINEFLHQNFFGIFVILLAAQWSYFLTFSIVIDSCLTSEADEKIGHDWLITFNWYYRLGVHVLSFGLLMTVFLVQDCYGRIYPANFVCLVLLILVHQVYDLYLAKNDYMIEWKKLPFTSTNKLRFNEELFKKQSKCLMLGNLLFGAVSIAIICFGFFVINKQSQPGNKQHIVCYEGDEWIQVSVEGQVFVMLHQLLILMQINFCIFVLIRIPKDHGVFDKDINHSVAFDLRNRLLKQVTHQKSSSEVNMEQKDQAEEEQVATADQSHKRSVTLQMFAWRQNEAINEADDNFRI